MGISSRTPKLLHLFQNVLWATTCLHLQTTDCKLYITKLILFRGAAATPPYQKLMCPAVSGTTDPAAACAFLVGCFWPFVLAASLYNKTKRF